MNTIYSIKEYVKQGFTKEEAYQVRRHDIIYNKGIARGGVWTEKENKEIEYIQKKLGL